MIGGTGSAEVGTGLFLMVIGQSQYGVSMPVSIEEEKKWRFGWVSLILD